MKTNLLLTTAMMCAIISCSSKEDMPEPPKEVILDLNYSFTESGSMGKTKSGNVYTTFYDTYIKTKVFTPSLYSLKFTNKETSAIATINGMWKNKDAIKLVTGTYLVEGTSWRYIDRIDASGAHASDTVFIAFNEEVAITSDMTTLNLNAKYDSYLLIFDTSNISSITYKEVVNYPLKKFDNIYAIFINKLSTSKTNSIEIVRLDGSKISISLDNVPFEKGKYYYFNDLTNSFDIPPMEAGN